MKPAPFDYVAPSSVSEVLELLKRYGEEAKLLAGGQSLMPMLGMRLHRAEVLIDLNRVDALQGIRREDGFVKVGAMTRHSDVERSSEVGESVPLLSQAVPLIGHAAIRNRGTLGGSLAHNHPASELPAVAAALEARFEVRSPSSSRTLSAQEFFTSYLSTDLGEDELLTEVSFPVLGEGWRTAFLEFSRRVGDFALVGVAAAARMEDGKCREARIALTGVGGVPTRATETEGILRDSALSPEVLERASEAVKGEVEPPSDFHGSSDYRRHLCGVFTRRALARIAGGE
ncbi:MAG TPA: xanthine dehydrogenase family protein subunit M [Nitrospinota bacterium]|nr:xanthine dehydrogenase family protein subunit M [Nitrospinota bacterium]